MPHIVSNSPFVTLRHDDACGRSTPPAAADTNGAAVNGLVNGTSNGVTNGHANGTPSSPSTPSSDEFLRLSQPQQDVLLLHGPGKRYSLEKAQEIPELKHEREILVQVLAIGLNPVDWKGADYGMSCKHYQRRGGRRTRR